MADGNNNQMSSNDANAQLKDDQKVKEPYREKRLLDPVDRFSEILYGIIMALTFTCTISVAQAGSNQVRSMLFAAVGCNIAWGLVDAVMFIITGLTQKERGKTILNFLHKTNQPEQAREYIADALPAVVSSVIGTENLENIRKSLLQLPESNLRTKVTAEDIKTAGAIFLLVFLSTFPVALPFVFIHDVQLALRISNLVAITFMFICGWFLATYAGFKKFVMGFALTLLGVILVVITISLGG